MRIKSIIIIFSFLLLVSTSCVTTGSSYLSNTSYEVRNEQSKASKRNHKENNLNKKFHKKNNKRIYKLVKITHYNNGYVRFQKIKRINHKFNKKSTKKIKRLQKSSPFSRK